MYNAITCCLQSVQKKATLQFKSLDATLQTYNKDTHQKEAVTYRCADINAMVPSLMGVSKVRLQYGTMIWFGVYHPAAVPWFASCLCRVLHCALCFVLHRALFGAVLCMTMFTASLASAGR
jgi:hypothetical protein